MDGEDGAGGGDGAPEFVVGDFTQEEITDLRNDGFLEDEVIIDDGSDEEREDYSACVVVDGLPQVPEAKYAALCSFVKKLVQQVDKATKKPLWPLASDEALYMPIVDGKTLGFAFIEYKTAKYAEFAIVNLNGKRFDARHTMTLNLYEDVHDYREIDDAFVAEEVEDFKEGVDPKSWLMDGQCRDQFLLRYASETAIHWAHPRGLPELCYDGETQKKKGRSWTDKEAMWSPQGNYLVTFHSRGLLLWGGPDFTELKRLEHNGVREAFFTKDERYLATWSGYRENDMPAGALVVWDLKSVTASAKKVREFKQLNKMRDDPDFYWSPDGKYLARVGLSTDKVPTELLYVYEADEPGMPLLNSRSIKVSGARDVCFPQGGRNVLAWWVPESASSYNAATCIRLMSLPDRKIIREKNVTEVNDCKMIWHPQGTFLCVQVTRHTKTKKRTYTHFQLFRVNEKDVPIQMIEIKEAVRSFSWEPNGTRFAIVYGDGARFTVGIYDMGKPGTPKPTMLWDLKDKAADSVHWSPKGGYAVLASLQLTACQLEFWDINNKHKMKQDDHFRCNSIQWEEAGRMVCTSVQSPITSGGGGVSDNGYALWTFQGTAVHSATEQKFFTFSWRPRPKSLLSDKQKKAVAKNLKRYIQRYQADDRRVAKKRELEMLLERQAEYKKFVDWYRKLRFVEYLDVAGEREELRDGAVSDPEDYDEVVEEHVMEISKKEVEVKAFTEEG